MKKTLLSLLAVCTLGVTATAQNIAIYEGLSSTTDISGTTINVQVSSSVYEGYFFAKSISGAPVSVKVRRVSIVTPPSAVTEQVCSGAIPDNDGTGACIDIDANTPNWLCPITVNLDATNKVNMEVHVNHHGSSGLVHNRYYIEDLNGNRLDSVDLKIGNIASIKENKTASVTFNAYPNPADDVINLAVQGTSGDNAVKLVDVLGNVVLEEKMGASKKLDVSSFRNGVYILSVYSGGALVQTRRIVVRH